MLTSYHITSAAVCRCGETLNPEIAVPCMPAATCLYVNEMPLQSALGYCEGTGKRSVSAAHLPVFPQSTG